MVKLLIELLDFLRSCAPLLVSLVVLTLLFILLSKSIKRHAKIYYFVFAIPFALIVIPTLLRLAGVQTPSLYTVPFLGELLRDYFHMAAFGHPILIIIMYMGALDMKTPGVKSLMSIRKEISIMSGFVVLSHTLIRVLNNLPPALLFFADKEAYLAKTEVFNETGAALTNFSFIVGIILVVLFIPLWVSSFDRIRNRMGYLKWKKFQRWAYVMYAVLFIHAVGIQVGDIMNPRHGRPAKPAVEQVVKVETKAPATQRRAPAFGFKDIKVDPMVKKYIHLGSLFLIYGSYLYLRLRKAKKDKAKRATAKA